jgi:DNA-binding transcriptional ArsR family regulator
MKEGPAIATIAALLGDPARANMLTALMAGKALTAGELAREAGVTPQTASGHLTRLLDGGLVLVSHQGRHRYYCLASLDVADVIERLMGLAGRNVRPRVRAKPKNEALRHARVCYDHLAGEVAAELFDRLQAMGAFEDDGKRLRLTAAGHAAFAAFGVDVAALQHGRRPLCRACLDWSERRPHLAGSAGAALLARFDTLNWVRRMEGSRVVIVTQTGETRLRNLFAQPMWKLPPGNSSSGKIMDDSGVSKSQSA